jgi:hypothetical protein
MEDSDRRTDTSEDTTWEGRERFGVGPTTTKMVAMARKGRRILGDDS